MPTLDLQPGPVDAIDTEVREYAPDTAYGSGESMSACAVAAVRRYAFLHFDLSGAVGATAVVSAHLYLYSPGAQASLGTWAVHRIAAANSSWAPGATWNFRDGSTLRWAGDTGADGGVDAGCSVDGTDVVAAAMGSATIDTAVALGDELGIELDAAQTLALIQNNDGLRLSRTDGGAARVVCSGNHAAPAYRPRLVIEYTEGGGAPVRQAVYLARRRAV